MTLLYIYKKVVKKFIDKTFFFWQMLGLHITAVHFYEPIPNTRKLKKELWHKNSELVGINLQEKNQISLLDSFVKDFRKEYDLFPKEVDVSNGGYYLGNNEFGPVDAEILYCMIRKLKPKRIIEVGSGYSTLLMVEAITRNKEDYGIDCKLTTIDPYYKKYVEKILPGSFELVKKEVQDVDFKKFNDLEENDILFIDSSHILKIGSDVQYEYLEILPRLNKGVVVHSHDIFMPAEYPERWVLREHRFFNEQYLLQAFLQFNNAFEVLWTSNYMKIKNPDLLSKAFYSYAKLDLVFPGSFWIKRI